MRFLLSLTLLLALGAALPAGVRAQNTAAPGTPDPGTAEPAPDPAGPRTPLTPESAPASAGGEAENAVLELVRKDKDGQEHRIRIVRTGTTDETGIFTVCSPQDDEPQDAPNVAVFSETGAGGVRITIDKNVIRVPLAVVTQRQPKEGQEGSDGRVEASAGTAQFLDTSPEGKTDRLSRCAVGVDPKPAPETVFVTQGKTELKGQKLVYDETDGIARIDGPITFARPSDDGPLTGQSERIEVNVDQEKTTLVGGVVLNSKGGRVSKAARVEYDDQANIARLIGTPEQPAESRQGNDVLSAQLLIYNLDRDEVVVRAGENGNITGEFQDEQGSSSSGPSSSPSPASRPPAP
ncbi:LptA/OstA family protein [Deinococcus hopiensis]|uniref:OstA-like protein n=1 Tax=Deinococcus hopiensis KR-140 TaxID=695939 RepID=A0A1W1V5N8_9DEIO|nr:LptA/OstA family protein [Deinococcus hopiensis]SMB88682.1 OstA-like protein [Deinococcus hopiensis KR-140]